MRRLADQGVAARLKSDRAVSQARALRRAMTNEEKVLWRTLREFSDAHWRKQAPIGPFIVDFACHAATLIVELDGGVHTQPDVAERDSEREAWLVGRGYKVLRYANSDVVADVGSIVRALAAEVAARTPTPSPSPQGGGERALPENS